MKTILFVLISTVIAVVSSCEKQEEMQSETWWINSTRVDCQGAGPMTCYQIQKGEKLGDEDWQLFYSSIKGFDFEPGQLYRIKVKVTEKEAPIPADASSKNYELVEIISQEMDASLKITNSWKVTQVAEITNPTSSKSGESLLFEFNAGKRSYFGDMGCNTVRGVIQENDGKTLILGAGASTKMACMDMSTEAAISQALTKTRSYEVGNRMMTFKDEAGNILITFQAVD